METEQTEGMFYREDGDYEGKDPKLAMVDAVCELMLWRMVNDMKKVNAEIRALFDRPDPDAIGPAERARLAALKERAADPQDRPAA